MAHFRKLSGGIAAILVGTLAMVVHVEAANAQEASAFKGQAAWEEFAQILRQEYAYFQRPGVDGPAILATNQARAIAAPDRAAFIDVIQSVSFQFADPHLTIGPFSGQEASLIPTGSDIYARFEMANGRAMVQSLRMGGPAAGVGLSVGQEITHIDGQPLADRMALIAGVPLNNMTQIQLDYLANVALAGWFGQDRRFTLVSGQEIHAPNVADFRRAIMALPPVSLSWRGQVAIVRINNRLGDNGTIAAFDALVPQLAPAAAIVMDLRNTPSGGNSTVARAIMGHFTQCARAYQRHDYFWEARDYGVPRNSFEILSPRLPFLARPLYVVGGHWTGSMGEGMMVGFDTIGALSVGSGLGDLLGGIEQRDLTISGAHMDMPVERIFTISGQAREDFVPDMALDNPEAIGEGDPALNAIMADARRHFGLARRARAHPFSACLSGF